MAEGYENDELSSVRFINLISHNLQFTAKAISINNVTKC